MKQEIKFKALPLRGVLSQEKETCLGRIIHNEKLDMARIVEDFANFARVDKFTAQMSVSQVASYIVKALGEGKRLDFGAFSLCLTMKGTVQGANGRFDPAKNSIEPKIYPGQQLATSLRGSIPNHPTT